MENVGGQNQSHSIRYHDPADTQQHAAFVRGVNDFLNKHGTLKRTQCFIKRDKFGTFLVLSLKQG